MNADLQIVLSIIIIVAFFTVLLYLIFLKNAKVQNFMYNADSSNKSDTVDEEFRILEENSIKIRYLSKRLKDK